MLMQIYVVIHHPRSDRAFFLNRGYDLICSCKRIIPPTKDQTDQTWDGWLPSQQHQRPEWIEGLPSTEFETYWVKPEYDPEPISE